MLLIHCDAAMALYNKCGLITNILLPHHGAKFCANTTTVSFNRGTNQGHMQVCLVHLCLKYRNTHVILYYRCTSTSVSACFILFFGAAGPGRR